MTIAVRRAVLDDAEAAARCHATCWQEAYAGIVDPVRLAEATADLDARMRRWRQSLADGAERWVAINPDGPDVPVTDRVIGFAAPGITRDHDVPSSLELYALYVREQWWGTGLAGRLLEVALGNEPACLWVFEANARAQAFYAKHGFRPDGMRKDEPRFGKPEIRMVRTAG